MSYLDKKLAAISGVVIFLVISFLAWHYFFGIELIELPSDFSYDAEIVSFDNFFDLESDNYLGPVQSDTDFGYQTISSSGDERIIENYFRVTTTDGDQIFATSKQLAVNAHSQEHIYDDGDRQRSGYLFAPRMTGPYSQVADKSPYVYWHINYDNPIYLDFRREENLYGLDTYVYESHFTSDQTADLGNIEGVGEDFGIILDVKLTVWVEPNTGYLVKYEDQAEAFYYSLTTNERLYPWNTFSNTFSNESILYHVGVAQNNVYKILIIGYVIPSLMIVLAVAGVFYVANRLYLKLVHRRQKARKNLTFLVPAVTFIITLGLSLLGWYMLSLYQDQASRQSFQQQAESYNQAIRQKLDIYFSVLSGAKGLIESSELVTRQEWQSYVDALGATDNYPGLQALGYAEVVDSGSLKSYETNVRETDVDDYQIYPEGLRDRYVPITYIEPFNLRNQRALGYDMYSEQTRRLAMNQARDLDEPAVSGKVTLVQEIDENIQSGFLIYLPIYEGNRDPIGIAIRRSEIASYVYAAFRAGNFIDSTIDPDTELMAIEIYDSATSLGATEDRLLYRSPHLLDNGVVNEELFLEYEFEAGGNVWILRYYALPDFSDRGINQYLPELAFVGGLIISLVLTLLILSISNRRTKALAIANKMTEKIRANQKRLNTFNYIVTLPNLSFNERINRIVKLATEELGLDLGIMSQVQGDTYTVKSYFSKTATSFKIGDKLLLADTYCSETLSHRRVLGINDVPKSKYQNHPCYQKTALASYIGAPIMVKDTVYGTLNFSGSSARSEPFSADEKQFVQLLALWLGRILEDQEVDRAKTEFVSMASHQLRTPLTAIKWNMELFLSDYGKRLSKAGKDLLGQVVNANEKMIGLVNGLLNISRIELGTFQVDPELIDLNSIVSNLVTEMEPGIISKGHEVTVSIDRSAQEFMADRRLMEIILQNLFSNAIKYTPENGQIEVSAQKIDNSIVIKVSDNGFGISESDQKQLFSKFFRAENVVKKSIEGTGLGLYIINAIIDTSGGQISFNSNKDNGSEFVVTYPATGMKAKHGNKKLS